MKATCILTKKTDLEILIESGDKAAINSMISQKEIALEEALENADFYTKINDEEKAGIESSRAKRLARDIEKLKTAI